MPRQAIPKLTDRMRTLPKQLNDAIDARRECRRTAAELRRLPPDTALDLDIFRGDANRIARRAVYGH